MRLQKLIRPITIRTGQNTYLRFKRMGGRDECFLASLLEEEIAHRDFAVRVLHNQLYKTEVDVQTVRDWSDALLLWVAYRWLKRSQRLGTSENSPSFASFRDILSRRIKATTQEAAAAAREAYHRWKGEAESLRYQFTSSWRDALGPEFESARFSTHRYAQLGRTVTQLHRLTAGNLMPSKLHNLPRSDLFGRAHLAAQMKSLSVPTKALPTHWSSLSVLAEAGRLNSPIRSVLAEVESYKAFHSAPHRAALAAQMKPGLASLAAFSRETPGRAVSTALLSASWFASMPESSWRNPRMAELLTSTHRARAEWAALIEVSTRNAFRHLPVLPNPARLFGLDSLNWLFRHLHNDFQQTRENLRRMQETARVQAEAEDVLMECGFGFLFPLLAFSYLRTLLGLANRTRDAVVTKRFLTMTKSEPFDARFTGLMQRSSLLSRRADVVIGAFQLHKEGQYKLSIPLLFKEFEGIFAELMRLSGMAGRKKGKFCAKGEDGKFKKSAPKNGGTAKDIVLNGLDAKVQHSRFDGHPVLERVVQVLPGELIQQRNAILHGRSVAYGTAKLSTQLLLLIFVLCMEVETLEGQRLAVTA